MELVLNVGRSTSQRKRPHHEKQAITCSNGCGFKAFLGCNSDGLWEVLEVGDLTEHTIECFCMEYRNSRIFLRVCEDTLLKVEECCFGTEAA